MSTSDVEGGFVVQPVRGTPDQWAAFRALNPVAQLDTAMAVLYMAMETRGGDYVYERHGNKAPGIICTYLAGDTPQPSCLIGMALWHLGCPVDDLVANGTVHALNGDRGWGLHAPTVLLWRAAQAAQDKGQTWADSVSMGNAMLVPLRHLAASLPATTL